MQVPFGRAELSLELCDVELCKVRLRTGTSGFSYKEWKGTFYPEDLPAKSFLSYYAEHFPTVEINNTFYRLPKRETLEKWADTVGEDFQFVLKASRRITHFKRLKEIDEVLEYFLETATALGPHQGPFLFQLPPNFKCDLDRLGAFLELLPAERRAVMEFRHASWFDEPVYELLRAHGVALCGTDTGGEHDAPLIRTTDWGYLRLRRVEYGDEDLVEWCERIAKADWSDVFVFFKHEDAGTGPRLAAQFRQLFEQRHG